MKIIYLLMKDPKERLVVGTLLISYVFCHEGGLVADLCWSVYVTDQLGLNFLFHA